MASKASGTSAGSSLLELIVIVAVALGLALGIQALLVKPYKIPSKSMVPTLLEGDRVLVNRIGMRFGDPEVGDVIVFHPPRGAEEFDVMCGSGRVPDDQACDRPTKEQSEDQNYIKRVVAGPGDTLAVVDGHVVLNGKQQREPFAEPCGGGEKCDLPKPITVPADHYFMMGDNRGASNDSRFWGPVPRDSVIGPAFATYWPPSRVGGL
ncbi:MAG: signal peptidase I [Actinomycetota bacterium]|nr:signal peptidase I [Actinomycetota bacterium]